MKRGFAVAMVVSLALAWVLVPAEIRNIWLSGSWSPVKSEHNYKGTYFRMKVSLAYKGEPQEFNVVYGCNVNYVRYKDGASTSEIGLVPSLYGRRMKDGKGLIVQAPNNACKPDYPRAYNPRLNPNFMPMVVVFENADELGFGTAYISEDAYAEPGADLQFKSASIHPATREEFEDFRSNGPRNLVRRETYHADNLTDENAKALGIPPIRPLDELPGLGFRCTAYARFKADEKASKALRNYWPQGKPRFWEPASFEDAQALDKELGWPNVAREDGDEFRELRSYRIEDSALNAGVRRRGDMGLVEPNLGYIPPAYYPAYSETALHFFPRNRAEWDAFVSKRESFADPVVEMQNGRLKGRGYCYRRGMPLDPVLMRHFLLKVKRIAIIDGEQAKLNPAINDGIGGDFFERDQYIWRLFQFGMGSTNGDL